MSPKYLYIVLLNCRFVNSMLLFCAVDAAGPAAWATLTLLQLRNCPLDVVFACLGFLGGDCPADPFVASQRRDIFPGFLGAGR